MRRDAGKSRYATCSCGHSTINRQQTVRLYTDFQKVFLSHRLSDERSVFNAD